MWRKKIGLAALVVLCAVLIITVASPKTEVAGEVPVYDDLIVSWDGTQPVVFTSISENEIQNLKENLIVTLNGLC